MDSNLALWRRAAAEGVAAFALVFAGCGAIIANRQYGGALGTVGIALAFGLVIMVMVYATGHLSGAHINPSVTIAFTLTRHFKVREAVAYITAQLVGATLAALVLLAIWPSKPADLGATVPTVAIGSAFVYEAILTAFLIFVIMAVATDTRAAGAAAAIAIRWRDRPRRAVRRTGHGCVDEPGPFVRSRVGLGHLDRLLGLPRRARCGRGGRRVRLPISPRRTPGHRFRAGRDD